MANAILNFHFDYVTTSLIMIIGVVLGVDSRLGYWDLVGGGEIRNMVSIVFFSTVSNPIYTREGKII